MMSILNQAIYSAKNEGGLYSHFNKKYTFADVGDQIPPSISSFAPTDATIDVVANSPVIQLTFNEDVKWGAGTIQIRAKSPIGSILQEFDANSGQGAVIVGGVLTLRPSIDLSPGTKYYVVVPNGAIKDLAGNNNLLVDFYDFTTAGTPDTTAPAVIDLSPVDGTIGVAVDSNIEFIFSEPVQRGIGKIEIRIDAATGALFESFDVISSTALTFAGDKLIINPISNLIGGIKYFVTIAKGAIKDRAGNDYAGINTYDFKTIDDVPPVITAFSPNNGANKVPVASSIIFTFNEPIKKGVGNITICLDSADGTVLETLDIATSRGVSVAGNVLTIKPSTVLQQGQKYVLMLDGGVVTDIANNFYAGINNYNFTTIDTTAPIITTFSPADGATGALVDSNIVLTFSEPVDTVSGKKIEIHKGTAIGEVLSSTQTLSDDKLTLTITPSTPLAEASSYFVTLAKGAVKDKAGNEYAGIVNYDFRTIDTAPPLLVEKNPLPGSTGVAVASNITLTFNKPVQKGIGTIELRASNSDTLIESFDVATSTRLRFSDKQLIIDPTNNLAQGGTYSLVISEGAIKDSSSNSYTINPDFDYHFTTLDQVAPTVILFSPSDGATAIATNGNISLMFSEAVQWGTGVIQLRSASATGPMLETFNTGYGGNAIIEGNILTIDPSIDLKPNTLYFLTIPNAAIKDVSGNSYVGTATYDFTTAADTKPPVVQTYRPADGVANVPLDGGIELSFDEVIVPGSGTIEIHVGSRLGPVVESFNVANSPQLQFVANLLTILPSAELEPETRYFVTLPRGAVKDASGNLYLGTSTYDFFTADTVSPVAIAFSPESGASGVELNSAIDIAFSEAIKAATGNIEIRLGSSPTSPLLENLPVDSNNVSIVGNMLKLTLSHPWGLDADYFIHIPAGSIKDVAGNLFQGTGYYFHTTSNSAGKFYNTPGNDVLNGSAAIDTAFYSGQGNNFTITRISGSNTWYVNGEGDDLLKNVERIQFSDKRIALDMGPEQNTGKAMLFWNVMNPSLVHSPEWLGQIIGLFDAGHSMPAVFNWAINTVESLTGPVSNNVLVEWVWGNFNYLHSINNLPGQSNFDPVTKESLFQLINNPSANYGRAEFLADVAELDVNVNYVAIVGGNYPGIEYI